MIKKMRAFIKLSRPSNTIAGALAVILGGYVAGTGAWGNILLAAVITFLVTASSNAWNDCLDVEIDRINQPHRVIPSGLITQREAAVFSVIMALLSLILGTFLGWIAFTIILVSNLVLYIYSARLKSTVLLGNATVAGIAATSAVLGGVAAGNVWPSLSLALVISTVIMSREILKTMADYEGDRAEQVKTVATVWGRKVAYVLFVLIALTGSAFLLVPYLLVNMRPIYIIILVFGIYPVLFYVITQVRHNAPAHKLERMSQLIKYDFFVWFVAVWLGTAV